MPQATKGAVMSESGSQRVWAEGREGIWREVSQITFSPICIFFTSKECVCVGVGVLNSMDL